MDIIELWSGSTKALVSIDGGWLTNLSDDYGDILFPKRKLEAADGNKKQRGGSHVCLPNFGPGGLSDQPQHGFGRAMVWQVQQQTQSAVALELPQGDEEYQALSSILTYALDGASLTMTLKVTNNGNESLRLAPGFHPYFSLKEGEGQVHVNDQTYDVQDLADTEFFTSDSATLRLDRRTITIRSADLTTWALWSDQLGNYVCCEPTLGGYLFENDEPQASELLAPGESRTYQASISW